MGETTSLRPSETTAAATTTVTESTADLSGVKDYLLAHTGQLAGFTAEFKADAEAYHELAEAAGFDYEALWSQSAISSPRCSKA